MTVMNLKSVSIFFYVLNISKIVVAHVRIVNGSNAEDGEFPFQASLKFHYGHLCGVSILNDKFVLTAAHCVCNGNIPQNPSGFNVQYGLTTLSGGDENLVPVKEISCNNFTSTGQIIHDLAVIELNYSLPHDGSWEAIKLAREFDTSEEQKGVILGWGQLADNGPYPDTLQKLEVNVYNDTICGANFNLEEHICVGAGQGSACGGDSGGALIVKEQQVGITSFGNWYCGISNETYPDIYVRIPTYYAWIEGIVGSL